MSRAVDEILLHFAGGGEGDEQVGSGADGGEGVRNLARGKNRLAGAQAQALIANLKGDLALHDVEPLLLRVVKMKCRAGAGLESAVFDDKQIAVCIRGCDLEGERTEAKRVWGTEAILTGGDGMKRGCRRRDVTLASFGRQVKAGFARPRWTERQQPGEGGAHCSGGFEKTAAGNGHDGNHT